MLKIVCDTNTLVSGLLWRGNEFKLLSAITERKAVLFTSPALINEFSRVVNYERLRPLVPDPAILIRRLTELAVVVEPSESVKIIKEDPADDRVLECALAANADYIVSGDKRHLLKLKQFYNIPIVTTQTILKEIYP